MEGIFHVRVSGNVFGCYATKYLSYLMLFLDQFYYSLLVTKNRLPSHVLQVSLEFGDASRLRALICLLLQCNILFVCLLIK